MKVVNNYVKTLNQNSEKLSSKNSKIFGDITVYIRTSSLKEIDCEEALQQILDMFLEAQDRGEEIENLIGNDYKAFADSIIDAYGKNNNFLTMFKYAIIIITVLTGIQFALDLAGKIITKKAISLNISLSLGLIFQWIFAAILCFIIFKLVHSSSFTEDKKEDRKSSILLFTIFFITITLMTIGRHYLDKYVLLNIPVYFILIPGTIMYFAINSYESHKYIKAKNITSKELFKNPKTKLTLKGLFNSYFFIIDLILQFSLAIILIYVVNDIVKSQIPEAHYFKTLFLNNGWLLLLFIALFVLRITLLRKIAKSN